MGSMIRHAFFGRVGSRCSLAEPVSALTVAMVEAAFETLLVAAASSAELLAAGKSSAIRAAIKLPSVAVRADEEERAAMRSLAKPLPEES